MAKDNGSFFSALLIGGAIGAIAGVLFAPKAGKELRDELINDNEDIINKAKSELDKMRDELGDLKDKLSKSMDRKKTTTKPSDIAEEADFEAGVNSMDEDATTIHTRKAEKN